MTFSGILTNTKMLTNTIVNFRIVSTTREEEEKEEEREEEEDIPFEITILFLLFL